MEILLLLAIIILGIGVLVILTLLEVGQRLRPRVGKSRPRRIPARPQDMPVELATYRLHNQRR